MANELKSMKLETELALYIQNNVSIFKDGMLNYPEHACCMPMDYKTIEEEILNFEVRPDDIWLLTFPKCGTTWSQEMIWMIGNDLDYEGAKVDIGQRFPFLEFPGLCKEINHFFGISNDDPLEGVRNMKSPRFIKSHLPVGLLPRQLCQVNPKIVYVMREPKDVAASLFNHYRLINGYTGDKTKFFEALLSDHLLCGSYFGNIAPIWNMRHQPNVLINTYEEMKNDLAAVIHRTAGFLGKPVAEEHMKKLLQHLDFSNMKYNDSCNLQYLVDTLRNIHGVGTDLTFINKGVIGNYKSVMSPDWIERVDVWTRHEKIKYGLMDEDFPY